MWLRARLQNELCIRTEGTNNKSVPPPPQSCGGVNLNIKYADSQFTQITNVFVCVFAWTVTGVTHQYRLKFIGKHKQIIKINRAD